MNRERDSRLESPALVGAAVAVGALYIAATIALGTPPRAGDSGALLVAWFREHHQGVRWYVWMLTVSAPLFAIVFALLRGALPPPYRDVFFTGAISFLVSTAVQTWSWGGLALHANLLEPATARTVLDVGIFWGPVLTGATMTMIAPVTILALRGRAGLPRWLGVLGLVAFAEQAIETVTIFGSSGFIEPGGPMNMLLGATLVAAWLLAFAIWVGARGSGEAAV